MTGADLDMRDVAPFVSVVVTVFDDPRLGLCLKALEGQTYPADRYEVVLVDNGSTRPVRIEPTRFPHVRLAVEPKPGSYAARNRGIALARGEVIALTDSDCIPTPTWIERGVAQITCHPGLGAVGGSIQIFFKNSARPNLVELFSTMGSRRQQANVQVDRFAETANLFTTRRVLDRVGPFDGRLKARGDVEWSQRVLAAGYELMYAEDVRVLHPAIASLGHLCRRTRRLTGGRHDVRRLYADPGTAATRSSVLDRGQLGPYMLRALRNEQFRRRDRPGVVAVMLLVHTIALLERARLRLGGISHR
jgi:glycosyltransferase involved in cell wall biosynthesis